MEVDGNIQTRIAFNSAYGAAWYKNGSNADPAGDKMNLILKSFESGFLSEALVEQIDTCDRHITLGVVVRQRAILPVGISGYMRFYLVERNG
jgi:hypothetical protein